MMSNMPQVAAPQVSAKALGSSARTKISTRGVDVFYGDKQALFNVTVDIPERAVTAFIGLMRFIALRWIFRPTGVRAAQ